MLAPTDPPIDVPDEVYDITKVFLRAPFVQIDSCTLVRLSLSERL